MLADGLNGLGTFLSSAGALFVWPTVGYMLIGTLLGFAVGMLPGLGGAATMALMLPLTFSMEPLAAVAFLLAMHATCATAGDVTSVLFGIPGEASSAATVFDGYPLTRMGQAGRAIGAVLTSSLAGAWFGAFCLALAVPLVRPLVLSFGPPEVFMLAVVALTTVAALSGKNMAKGLAMASLGVLLATVGEDIATAQTRLTFDSLYLLDGVPVVPVVIGMFAVPAILASMLAAKSGIGNQPVRINSWTEGAKDTWRHKWLVLRTSLIGAYVGLIPGVGGTSAQFIAYGHALQSSKEPEKFGKGSIEGLLAAGSVNNSKEGGSLIPTVAFGIPGSGAMAILISALIITGVQPGPDLLTTDVNVTFGMVWTIVIANLLCVALCLLLAKRIASLADMRQTLIVPLLLVFITVGSFTESFRFEDIMLMVIVGLVAFWAERLSWPVAPMLIGLVLGKLAEANFFLANNIYGDPSAWLTRPIVLILALIALISLASPLIRYLRNRRKAHGDPMAKARPLTRADIALAGLFAAIGAVAFFEVRGAELPTSAALVPESIAFILTALCLGIAVLGAATMMRRHPPTPPHDPDGSAGARPSPDSDGATTIVALKEKTAEAEEAEVVEAGSRQIVMVVGQFLLFIAGLWAFGFLLFTPLFAAVYLFVVAKTKWWTAAIWGVVVWAFLYYILWGVLSLRLWSGVFF
ncbi:MAG: Tripartite tricarboxylate transporter TctA family protein [Mycobacterium sp.]|nr:Tripartite tricarboxylate transporter TctA family protein [Mycobacterium sp.]